MLQDQQDTDWLVAGIENQSDFDVELDKCIESIQEMEVLRVNDVLHNVLQPTP